MHSFEFSSILPAEYHDELEALMFFNPQQSVASTGILQSIEKYGAPRICVEGDLLRVTVGALNDVQTLFALADADEGYELAGLVLYLRTDIHTILILHIAVTASFSSAGPNAEAMLVLRLLQAVRDAACRLKGVRSITIVYPIAGPLKMAVRSPKLPAVPSAS